MGLNNASVGTRYLDDEFVISKRESIFFALATGEDNPAYFDPRCSEGEIVVPPIYAAIYAHGPIARALRDPSVGIRYQTIVHYSQDFEWLAPVRPGDTILNSAVIDQADNFENGGLLGISVSSHNSEGTLVTRSRWCFFDRSIRENGAGRPPRAAAFEGSPIFSNRTTLPTYLPFVYAEASGDRNGIHVDEQQAAAVGLPGIIVHGFSTMAYCQKVIVDHLTGPHRDPRKLTALKLRFSKPVFPGDIIEFEGFRIEETDTVLKFGINATRNHGETVLRGVEGVVNL